ncbi:hypothetical protein KY359_06820 [Candidatus Woesearchaeota archaeon]|nr:hypothetical protein [Candidatus Woesearchaeota archaeon]
MEYLKPRDVSRMRNLGKITRAEFEVISNMQARGLRPALNGTTLSFKNGGPGPVASIELGNLVAELYPANCGGEENAERYSNGLIVAGYEVNRC